MIRYAVAGIAALVWIVPAGAQQNNTTSEQTPIRTQTPPKHDTDIVVEGLRQEKQNIDQSLAPVPSEVGYKTLASNSAVFARCAKNVSVKQLHALIDGMPNTPPNKMALDRIVRSHVGCYLGYPSPSPDPPFFGDCNPQPVEDALDTLAPVPMMCAAFYDRGAVLAAAIDRYAPDFSLARRDVSNRKVQIRLDQREVPRNRFRLPEDQAYFQAAICMVRLQPELATRMVRAYGNARLQAKIGQLILVRAKPCVGDPKRIKVEPGQFSIYITDAAYRWEVAARNVDSLLPASD